MKTMISKSNKRIAYASRRTVRQADAMTDTWRYIHLRGYIRHVKVEGINADGEYIVWTGYRREPVPGHLFYHLRSDGRERVLRDSPEFLRRWPDHPIHVEKLPE